MRKTLGILIGTAVAMALAMPVAAHAGEHRFGFGYHYWKTSDTVQGLGEIKDNGDAAVFSYQYLPGGFLRFEGDVEYFPDGFGGSLGKAYSPQVYALFGRFFYAGVGVGATHSNDFPSGDAWSDPWYAARAGIDMLLLPRIHLDLNANYRADAFRDLQDAKTDALTFGASVRLTLF